MTLTSDQDMSVLYSSLVRMLQTLLMKAATPAEGGGPRAAGGELPDAAISPSFSPSYVALPTS